MNNIDSLSSEDRQRTYEEFCALGEGTKIRMENSNDDDDLIMITASDLREVRVLEFRDRIANSKYAGNERYLSRLAQFAHSEELRLAAQQAIWEHLNEAQRAQILYGQALPFGGEILRAESIKEGISRSLTGLTVADTNAILKQARQSIRERVDNLASPRDASSRTDYNRQLAAASRDSATLDLIDRLVVYHTFSNVGIDAVVPVLKTSVALNRKEINYGFWSQKQLAGLPTYGAFDLWSKWQQWGQNSRIRELAPSYQDGFRAEFDAQKKIVVKPVDGTSPASYKKRWESTGYVDGAAQWVQYRPGGQVDYIIRSHRDSDRLNAIERALQFVVRLSPYADPYAGFGRFTFNWNYYEGIDEQDYFGLQMGERFEGTQTKTDLNSTVPMALRQRWGDVEDQSIIARHDGTIKVTNVQPQEQVTVNLKDGRKSWKLGRGELSVAEQADGKLKVQGVRTRKDPADPKKSIREDIDQVVDLNDVGPTTFDTGSSKYTLSKGFFGGLKVTAQDTRTDKTSTVKLTSENASFIVNAGGKEILVPYSAIAKRNFHDILSWDADTQTGRGYDIDIRKRGYLGKEYELTIKPYDYTSTSPTGPPAPQYHAPYHSVQYHQLAAEEWMRAEKDLMDGIEQHMQNLPPATATPQSSAQTPAARAAQPAAQRGILEQNNVGNIVFSFSYTLATGGVASFQRGIIEGLLRSNPGVDIHLVYLGPTSTVTTKAVTINGRKVVFHGVPTRGGVNSTQQRKIVAEILSDINGQKKIDLVVNNDAENVDFARGLLDFCEGQRVPLHSYYHGGNISTGTLEIMSRSTTAVTNSQAYARIFERLGVPNVQVLYPVPDLTYFSRSAMSQSDADEAAELIKQYQLQGKTVIIHPGRVDFQKGQVDTIDAAALLKAKKEGKDVVFIIIGPAVSAEEKARLTHRAFVTHGLKEGQDIIFVPGQTRRQIRQWLSIADLVLYPSRWVEPFGLVPVEAQSMGVPVVVSSEGGLPETLSEGETGLIVPKKDPVALADAIGSLLVDRAKMRTMAARAPEFVKERFGDGGNLRGYEDSYLSAVSRGKKGERMLANPVRNGDMRDVRFDPNHSVGTWEEAMTVAERDWDASRRESEARAMQAAEAPSVQPYSTSPYLASAYDGQGPGQAGVGGTGEGGGIVGSGAGGSKVEVKSEPPATPKVDA
jgi:glycosyltransferase involved in cell wall biosynthesis